MKLGKVQRFTYLKLTGVKMAWLVNFNNTKLKDGIKRFVHGSFSFVLFGSFVVVLFVIVHCAKDRV